MKRHHKKILGISLVLVIILLPIILHLTPSLAVRAQLARHGYFEALTSKIEKVKVNRVDEELYQIDQVPPHTEVEYFTIGKGDGLFRYTAEFYFRN
ncbi:hypothetical protein ACWOEH_11530 [Enterococcus nangangensis]